LTKEAKAQLATAAMVDQAKGVVRIPIEDAKKAVLAELKSKPVGPSQVKVDPWLPMPPPVDPMPPSHRHRPSLPRRKALTPSVSRPLPQSNVCRNR
jgi:hypothetical protein